LVKALRAAKLLKRIRKISEHIAKINGIRFISISIEGPPESKDFSIVGYFEKTVCPICGLKNLNCTDKVPIIKVFKITPNDVEEDDIVGEVIRLMTRWAVFKNG